jgi:hypothetical protein
MNRNERAALFVIFCLLAVGFLLFKLTSGGRPLPAHSPDSLFSSSTVTPVRASSAPVKPAVPAAALSASTPTAKPAVKPVKAAPPATAPDVAPPPAVKLHKELIPKDISIVRFSYGGQDIASPGTSFGFDLNGSGFSSEFEKMIKVEVPNTGVEITDLKLVTVNQITGNIHVKPDAVTGFAYPRVLIKGLPVFTAPEPFAIVRPGDVLAIFIASQDATGRAGRFRVITNLTQEMAQSFRLEPSSAGIQISNIEAHLPYLIEGTLSINPGVPTGEYGLTAYVGDKMALQRPSMIRIVRPNVGQSGFVQGVTPVDRFHRPGDVIQLYLQGTGFSPEDTGMLSARVEGFDMGAASFTYVSGNQMRFTFQSPPNAPAGPYGLSVMGRDGAKLFEKKDVFRMVGPNWVAGVQVSPPVRPGSQGQLKVLGRDFSDEFAAQLSITVDDEGIVLGKLQKQDPQTLVAEISVSSAVAPGDYWLHLQAAGKKVDPPYGSLIKVEKP